MNVFACILVVFYCISVIFLYYLVLYIYHNILEPTTGVTFFNSGSKSDPTELFPSIVLVMADEKRFPPI
jgi:hypothetical protein